MFFQVAEQYVPESDAGTDLERRTFQLSKHLLFSFIGRYQKKIIVPVPE